MQKFIIPREGLLVRDPKSFTPLPENGVYVDWDGNAGRFWRRRVRCGDVSIQKQEIKEEFVIEETEENETAEPLQSKRKKRGN